MYVRSMLTLRSIVSVWPNVVICVPDTIAHVCLYHLLCSPARNQRLFAAESEAEKEIQAYRDELEAQFQKELNAVGGAVLAGLCPPP